ncbi:MAG: MATE family efflux transporter [Marinifilaceae bacterium]
MNDLGKDSVGKLLVRLASPAIVAQVVNVLYTIVDRIFIGRMENGELAMAGVGVTMPLIMLVAAFSALFGMGGAPRCAIRLGAGDKQGAEKIMTNSFSMLILTGLCLTTVFILFRYPLLWAFGASEATIDYAVNYLTIYMCGTVFVQLSLGMNPFINTQGFAKVGMMTVIIGAAINVVLDPIFIFYLNMGVKGAALATIIAQGVSALWVMRFLVAGKSQLAIRKKYIIPEWKTVLNIVSLGVSPFIMQSTECAVLISLNSQLARFGGDLSVGAMTIITSISCMILMPLQGLSQGLQPIVSYNYGAGLLPRVRKAIKLAYSVGMGYNVLFCTSLMLFPMFFVRIFNTDVQLVAITSRYIHIYFIGLFIFGGQIICQQIFLSLGQAKISVFLATLRKIILLVPLIYILPYFFATKENGVLFAEPISDITAALTTHILFLRFYRKYLKEDNNLHVAKQKDTFVKI